MVFGVSIANYGKHVEAGYKRERDSTHQSRHENERDNMKQTTRDAIIAICAADTTLKAEDIDRALAILDGHKAGDIRLDKTPVTYGDAAKMLGVCRKTVVRYVAKGAIRKVKIPGERQGQRLVRADVEALRDGKTVEPVQA